MNERYDLAIIGSGPAGLSAALNAQIRKKKFIIFGTNEISGKLTKAEKINNYLGEKEAPQKADIILVFGSHDIRRVEVAVDYWKQGLAPLLVMTGGSPHYGSRELPEAETFKQEAVRMGVPENAIITEPNSITIPDNVRSTFNVLDEQNIEFTNVIAVVSWFAMRRVWVHLQKYGNGSIRIYRSCPKPHNPLLKPDEWFLHDEGIKVIFNEFVKMRVSQMMNTA